MLDWGCANGVAKLCILIWYGKNGLHELGNEEFPPISPLQLFLLCPNLPEALHCLEIPALLPVGSLGSFALFFLGLACGFLLIEGFIGHF